MSEKTADDAQMKGEEFDPRIKNQTAAVNLVELSSRIKIEEKLSPKTNPLAAIVKEIGEVLAKNSLQPILPPDNSERKLIILCNVSNFGNVHFIDKMKEYRFLFDELPGLQESIDRIQKMQILEVNCSEIEVQKHQKHSMDSMRISLFNLIFAKFVKMKMITTKNNDYNEEFVKFEKELQKIDSQLSHFDENLKLQRCCMWDFDLQNLAYLLRKHGVLLFLDEISVLHTNLGIKGSPMERMCDAWKHFLDPFVCYGGIICAGKGLYWNEEEEKSFGKVPIGVFFPQLAGLNPELFKICRMTKIDY